MTKATTVMATATEGSYLTIPPEWRGFIESTLTLDERARQVLILLAKDFESSTTDAEKECLRLHAYALIAGRSLANVSLDQIATADGLAAHAIHRQEVGKLIRFNRCRQGLSQATLAKLSGVTQNQISKLENGICTATFLTIFKLSNALGIRPSELDVSYNDSDIAKMESLSTS